VPFTTVLRHWFERKRGLAFSLLFFGAGGGFAWYPAIAFLVKSGGWRYAFKVEALVVAAIMIPLILLIVRYHPRDRGLVPDRVSQSPKTPSNTESGQTHIVDPDWAARDWTLSMAVKTSRFWLLCLATFSIWGIMQHIMVAHHVAFATDLGYSKIYASSVLSLFGIFFALGSLSAFISDRIGREITMTIGTVIGITGIFVLTLLRDPSHAWMLYFYAIAFGFGLGMGAPLIAATTTDIFQGPKVGSTIGFVWFSFAVGGTIGPWLGGWLFEWTHDYEIAFVVAMVWYAIACAAIWLAAPRKVRLSPSHIRLRRKAG
jgi:MFS family permease